MQKVAFHNLGCKVNAYETQSMQELMETQGFEVVPFEEVADVYVVNTCTVTNLADRKSRQMLRRARKKNPSAVVVAAGCYVQDHGDGEHMADIIIGNDSKGQIARLVNQYMKNRERVRAGDDHGEKNYEELSIKGYSGNTRAFVKIQDGCDQFCAYCIIPYKRGAARSREESSIIDEIRTLGDNGYKEVVLTGIHLSAYGRDTKTNLLELLDKINLVEGIERIRLGSLEPGIVTEEFVNRCYAIEKVCPHFHLSLQSGCNDTLRRMNRKYTTKTYQESCDLLRKKYSHPSITTDLIVGFPGETEAEFNETGEFVKGIDFHNIHVFKYSRRAGTAADRMPAQVPEEEKTLRSHVILALAKASREKYENAYIGTTQEVLIEEKIIKNGIVYLGGYNREYVKIGVPLDRADGVNELRPIFVESSLQFLGK